MNDAIATTDNATILEQVVVGGDLSRLTPADRLQYYKAVCESVGLNPLTRPFDYLTLSGRLVLYAKKDATDQLRKIHGVSITGLEPKMMTGDLYVVTASAKDREGRVDAATGAVFLGKAIGEVAANLLMKAETKAKRRVTLSLCGLGMLDESEIDSIQGAVIGEPSPTVTSSAGSLFDEEERHSLIAEATRLGKELKMTATDKRAVMLEHLGATDPDLFTVDIASLATMVAALKKLEDTKKARA